MGTREGLNSQGWLNRIQFVISVQDTQSYCLMPGTFGKFVLPSLFASGAVFTALSLPLAVYGSERVEVPITESVGFSGVLKDFTAPYLGLSGLVSLAVGGIGLTLTGVGHSKRRAAALEQQHLETQQALKGREAEIQSILMSDKALDNAGLSFFLDDVPSLPQSRGTENVAPVAAIAPMHVVPVPSVMAPVMAPVMAAVDLQPMNFSVNATIAGIQPVKVPQVTVQTSISPMPAAHGFLGFMRSGQSVPSAAIAWLEEAEPVAPQAVQLQDLQTQLHSLMTQIEQLQSSIQSQTAPAPASIEVITQSEMAKNNVTAHRFQPFEHAWAGAPQRLAS
jgi:hypothetical protein